MTTTAQVTVVVTALPHLNFTVNGQNSAIVPPSQSYTLAWNTLNVTSCTATGAWAGDKQGSGTRGFMCPTSAALPAHGSPPTAVP